MIYKWYANKSDPSITIIMPHSTTADLVTPSSPLEEDSELPDAPPHSLDIQEEGERDNQKGLENGVPAREEAKTDIKLEDLFNDDDEEDEEFPSSGATTGMIENSPPAVPM